MRLPLGGRHPASLLIDAIGSNFELLSAPLASKEQAHRAQSMSVSARYLVWMEFGMCGGRLPSDFCKRNIHSSLQEQIKDQRACLALVREDTGIPRERCCFMCPLLEPLAPLLTHLLGSFSLKARTCPRTNLNSPTECACLLGCPVVSYEHLSLRGNCRAIPGKPVSNGGSSGS